MKKCLRPQGAPGWYDGECQLPVGHKGDCDEHGDPKMAYREETTQRQATERDNLRVFNPVTREEFNGLIEQVFQISKTVEGIQQLLGKAAEYQGKPRGRLPR